MSDILHSLKGALHSDAIVADRGSLSRFQTDWRGICAQEAICAVLPRSVREVVEVVKACRQARVGVVPQGGNTGLVSGAVPSSSGPQVIVNLSRMNRILEVNPVDNIIHCEAGVVLAAAQVAAQQCDRLLPLSLAAEGSCQIGGNVSTNAGGVQTVAYGSTRALVLGLEAVLPDGQVVRALRNIRKDSVGLDLKQLFIGSEGTLGIVTEAILRLVPNPRQRTTLLFGVQDVSSAVEIYSAVYEHFSSELISYEFFNHMSMELVGRNLPQTHIPISGDYPGYVLCELASGDEQRDFIGGIDTALGRWMGSGVIGEPVIAQSEAQRRVLWAVREGIPEAEQREGFSLKHDVAVPISKIAALCGSVHSMMESSYSVARPRLSIFGHIGEGNLHINILPAVGVTSDRFKSEMKSLSRCVENAAVAVGGSFSAEHGIGQSRIEKLARYRGGVDIALMKAIKAALDPEGLMNPGKILSGAESYAT